MVELLSVEKFADVINKASDSDGATPLMRCCESGALDCAQLLVERGADINAENIRNGARARSLSPPAAPDIPHTSYTTTHTYRNAATPLAHLAALGAASATVLHWYT